MAGFFQRIFRIGGAEAHSMLDKLEDPVKMTEQGIRDLKTELEKALKSFAEVKSLEIKSKRDMEKALNESTDWERKAMGLLQSAQGGKMDSRPEYCRLAYSPAAGQ